MAQTNTYREPLFSAVFTRGSTSFRQLIVLKTLNRLLPLLLFFTVFFRFLLYLTSAFLANSQAFSTAWWYAIYNFRFHICSYNVRHFRWPFTLTSIPPGSTKEIIFIVSATLLSTNTATNLSLLTHPPLGTPTDLLTRPQILWHAHWHFGTPTNLITHPLTFWHAHQSYDTPTDLFACPPILWHTHSPFNTPTNLLTCPLTLWPTN